MTPLEERLCAEIQQLKAERDAARMKVVRLRTALRVAVHEAEARIALLIDLCKEDP
jgi:hypothetical protein